MMHKLSFLVALVGLLGCATPVDPPPSVLARVGEASAGGETGAGGSSTGGATASGGQDGSGGAPAGGCGENGAFACMNPPLLDPLSVGPAGQWTYHQIPDTTCRDGSPAGFFTRTSDASTKLVIYLEQGGACFNGTLCAFNPASVSQSITGRTLAEAIVGMHPDIPQAPQATGMFDVTDARNPYADWDAVWIPYCTGDAYAGSNPDAVIDGVEATRFVGHLNMRKFIGHIVPTFQEAERVVLTGTSAGSFGAGLNYNMVQDAFGRTPVTVIMDSGIPFGDAFMAPCLQKQWRELWKFDQLLPPDCDECFREDGGGLMNLVFYSARKYPSARLGVVSAMEDDIMRFFYGFGENDCGGGTFADGKYTSALSDLRSRAAPYQSQFASYFVPGLLHMYSQFPDFYQPLSGGTPLSTWVGDVLAGDLHDVGP